MAELTVLRLSQQESFSDKYEPRLNILDVYKDKEGSLRLKSPITNRQEDKYDFRHLIILNQKHSLVVTLIEHEHQQFR